MRRVDGMILWVHEHRPYVYAIKRWEAIFAINILVWIVVFPVFRRKRWVVAGRLPSKNGKRCVPNWQTQVSATVPSTAWVVGRQSRWNCCWMTIARVECRCSLLNIPVDDVHCNAIRRPTERRRNHPAAHKRGRPMHRANSFSTCVTYARSRACMLSYRIPPSQLLCFCAPRTEHATA